MKVLVVGPDRQDPGGVANYYNAVFPRLSDGAVAAHYLEIGSTRGHGRGLHIILDQIRFWRTITHINPDIIHLNPSLDLKSFLRDGMFVFLAKLRRKPVLVFFRGWQEPFEKTVSGKLKWFFKATYGRSDGFIVLAKSFSERLREWGITAPIYPGNTTVANELLEGFSIDRKIEDISGTEVVRLLYLARLEREKGVLELLDAVHMLIHRGVPVSLTIAGDGPIMNEVRQHVAKFGSHQDKVKIIGYVRGQDKKDALRTHQVYCFPTQYGEGMPNSVLEAMAFGMAVVTCPVGGIADFFENDRMGVLLKTTDPEEMAKTIAALIESRERLIDIAQYNYLYAQSRFLASTAAETLRVRYREILSVHGRLVPQ
jgi:glycosyltransferase involved in cell wall biosynthesis